MTSVNVTVRKGNQIITTVERPLHDTANGPAVRFRRRLWLLTDNTIDLDGPQLEDEEQPEAIELPPPFEEGPDSAQNHVIALPASARMLVNAGPGTGKTHAACQRIASLINNGISANRIWVVSFTRTAIVEFRNRIAASLRNATDAASVRIATLDSHAWAIQSGFSPTATLTGDYEDNIQSAMERVRGDADAADYFHTLQHLIIDEAQDVLGIRAEFVAQIIDKLRPEAGVTVFADDAQSIFGFTEDDGAKTTSTRLLALLQNRGFSETDLTRVHRTRDPRLRQLFTDVRRRVLASTNRPKAHCEQIRQEIIRLAHTGIGPASELTLKGMNDNTLVLMRRRAEVLERSARNGDVPHRLRMAGLPVRLLPWLAAIFWDFIDGTKFPWVEFEKRWSERVHGPLAVRTTTAAEAWPLLVETAGINARVIDLRVLRSVLGRSSPPMLFCSPEYGDHGPIIGTVHASKGREADEVRLFLSPLDPEADNPEEEARVGFVGATRARTQLHVGEGSPIRNRQLDSGRVFRTTRTRKLQVEIGRTQDLNANGLVGQRAFGSAADAKGAQDIWCAQPLHQQLMALQQRTLDYEYELLNENRNRLAVLSPAFKIEMNEIASKVDRWPAANAFPYIRSLGLRSLVLSSDHPELETLHDPWRRSGFLFAPLLTGYSSGRFGRNG
ncbi:ATP-dependent helicase [Bradyrhizobium sp. AUGA SZCCT0169]|uniref:UvrD-helicase domain-containing protein n=1 Tax=Bradyrhizobium sp. AUGA SZCCT0169 TaxID=2807663 RepID=UPI001BA82027|nr:UvrD-helicase domain-containing protein [Bradyrhizobium sp. AUGA SZCCT0169]MBR1247496.1 ATP-dependent helicase [Bradyrhizobium sp. AUGA SZCCT0169]